MKTPPQQCTCGAPVQSHYEVKTKHAWCTYGCGTDRCYPGSEPMEDTGLMADRSDMCRYTTELRRRLGLTPSQAAKLWPARKA